MGSYRMPRREASRKSAPARLARGSLLGGEEVAIMRMTRLFAVALGPVLLAAMLLAGCEKGPAEKAGERVDKAVDKLTGKGPAEKAGERIDEAAKELTKKK